MDSRFMMTALSGTSTERNTAMSKRNDSASTPATTTGVLLPSTLLMS
jgi:hypothetical protein